MCIRDRFNGEYIKAMTVEQFAEVAKPYFEQVIKKPLDFVKIASILQKRTTKLTDIPEKVAFFEEQPEYDKELFVNKKSKTNLENSPVILKAVSYTHLDVYKRQEKELLSVKMPIKPKNMVQNFILVKII